MSYTASSSPLSFHTRAPSLPAFVLFHSAKQQQQLTNESALRSTHGGSGPDSHSHLHSRQQIHRGAARVEAEGQVTMAPFALDVRYGPRKFRIACRGPTTVARARRAICRRARVDAATLRTAERALDDAEVIESAATLVLVDSRSKLPPAHAAQGCGGNDAPGGSQTVSCSVPVQGNSCSCSSSKGI